MSRRPPDRKTIIVSLVIGLLVIALVSLALGGTSLIRLIRLLVVYGAAFLILLYVFQAMRRR